MNFRDFALCWATKLGTVFGLVAPRVHIPDDYETDMRHAFRNYRGVMRGAQDIARGLHAKQINDNGGASELRVAAAKATSTVDSIVKEMKERR